MGHALGAVSSAVEVGYPGDFTVAIIRAETSGGGSSSPHAVMF